MQARGLTQAEVARRSGIDRKRISAYAMGRGTPVPDTVISIADTLGVEARWLIRGEGPRQASANPGAEDDEVLLPRYDLFAFEGVRPPAPIEKVPLRRALLASLTKVRADLWLAEMPSDAMVNTAPPGATIICGPADSPLHERRIYVFLLHGRPIVRRVTLLVDNLVLEADNPSIAPIELTEDIGDLIPIARVVAAIKPV